MQKYFLSLWPVCAGFLLWAHTLDLEVLVAECYNKINAELELWWGSVHSKWAFNSGATYRCWDLNLAHRLLWRSISNHSIFHLVHDCKLDGRSSCLLFFFYLSCLCFHKFHVAKIQNCPRIAFVFPQLVFMLGKMFIKKCSFFLSLLQIHANGKADGSWQTVLVLSIQSHFSLCWMTLAMTLKSLI